MKFKFFNSATALMIGVGVGASIFTLVAFNGNSGQSGSAPLIVKSYDMPTSMNLGGESVPLDRFEVRERIDREMMDHLFKHSSTMGCIKLAKRYFPIMESALARHGVPDDFKYLAVIESTLRNLTSPAGARGIWQFMRATANQYGLEVSNDVDERLHIEKSTEAACKYLMASKNRFGSWTAAAAAYNAGDGRISQVSRDQFSDNYYDLVLVSETSRYVPRIIAMKEVMANAEKYGYLIDDDTKYPELNDITYVEVTKSISSLPAFAKEYGISYSTFKFYNPWLVSNSLSNPTGKSYQIAIPKNQK
jgi:membrane-bound lytic murein transglycosylase D